MRDILYRTMTLLCLLLAAQASTKSYAGDLHFGGFSELTFSGESTTDPTKTGKDAFGMGGLDLYLTKNLDDKTNVLMEVVYEVNDENEAVLDPERMYIQHEISPWFKVAAGRVHTALGYWNETFHHGSWLQTSVGRPSIFNFEDEGGVLPVHNIGLEFRGSGDVGPGEFGYIGNIGNGRGPNADPPQSAVDADRRKATNLLLYYRLPELGNLQFGIVNYADNPAATTNFDSDSDSTTAGVFREGFKENITGVHTTWHPGNTELIFEGFNIHHKYDNSGALGEKDNTILAYYLQASHKLNKFTPYVRYSVISADSSGDIYLHLLADQSQKTLSTGIRYDLTYTSAIKGEYETTETNTATKVTDTIAKLNWSYAW